jgi:hypothetical protein
MVMSKLTIVLRKVIDPAEEIDGLTVPFYEVYRDWGNSQALLAYSCQTEPEAWEYLAYICSIRAKEPPIL